MAVPNLVQPSDDAFNSTSPPTRPPYGPDKLQTRTSVAMVVSLFLFIALVLGLIVAARWRSHSSAPRPAHTLPSPIAARPQRQQPFIARVRAPPRALTVPPSIRGISPAPSSTTCTGSATMDDAKGTSLTTLAKDDDDDASTTVELTEVAVQAGHELIT